MIKPVFLSYFLDGHTPAYGGAKNVVSLEQIKSINNGDTSNNLNISFPGHIGTHIDFPSHFSESGKSCIDYPASYWIFKKVGFLQCAIQEVNEQINQMPQDIELLILKTGFGKKRTQTEYWASQPVIPASFAKLFRDRFPLLRVFGFDMISLTSKLDREEGKRAHVDFLINEEILVLEDMNLEPITCSPETFIICPLLIAVADGVPCTVIGL